MAALRLRDNSVERTVLEMGREAAMVRIPTETVKRGKYIKEHIEEGEVDRRRKGYKQTSE